MPYFTPDQYHLARNASLADYIRSRGYGLKLHGHEMLLIHPKTGTTTIRGNLWYRHSRGIGGGPLESLTQIEGIPEDEAVLILAESAARGPFSFDFALLDEPPRKPFELPAAAKYPARVFAYLHKTRCIDGDVIRRCFEDKSLFESAKHHNCVFVGCDGDTPKYASLRGTNTFKEKPFRMDIAGSDKRYPFLMHGKSGTAFAFESPIDAMSHASYYKLFGKDWTLDTRLSLGGVSELGLMDFLKKNAQIKEVVLCLDNDRAGIEATKRIGRELKEMGLEVCKQPPPGGHKDWNESIQAHYARDRPRAPCEEDEDEFEA
jgi:hypothetical protein